MQTEKHAYEFLVRWDRDGRLSGAHAQFRYVTRDDAGTVVGEFLGAAEPVGVAGTAGFPLADIADQALIAALAGVERLTTERDALATRLAALDSASNPVPGASA